MLKNNKLSRSEVVCLSEPDKFLYYFWKSFFSEYAPRFYTFENEGRFPFFYPLPDKKYVIPYWLPWVYHVLKINPKTNIVSSTIRVNTKLNPNGELFLHELEQKINGSKLNPIQWKFKTGKTFSELSITTNEFNLKKRQDRKNAMIWLFYHVSLPGSFIEEIIG